MTNLTTLKNRILMAFVFAMIVIPIYGQDDPVPADMRAFFNAIQQVETGGETDPSRAVGDNGKSLGWYQIGRAYWIDATQFDRSIGGEYQDVTNRRYAERVMMAYFKRYAREALAARDWERLARLHNGGPRGPDRRSTLEYWHKVQAALRSNSGD